MRRARARIAQFPFDAIDEISSIGTNGFARKSEYTRSLGQLLAEV
jgi:hypothetical protein